MTDLSGVPESALANLGRRAVAARAKRPLLRDPLAVEVAERLDHDFSAAPRGASLHALRVLTFDRAVRDFLRRYPAGTVVALGEGLETQFWRVDNGTANWVSVDLSPVIALRRELLPDETRVRLHAGSALDLTWADGVQAPALVTAQGLLPYFPREEVHSLIAAIAERLPGSSFVFDVVPMRMLKVVERMSGRERDQAVELWTWLFDADERAALERIPGVASIRDLSPPVKLGVAPLALRAVRALPRKLRYSLPVLPVLEMQLAR